MIDTESIWDRGQVEFLGRRGRTYDRERTKHLLTGTSLAEGTRVLMEQYELEGDPDELARERADIVRELFPETGFVPGFRDFYAAARQRYRTCLATAMAEDLLAVVDAALGLRELFGGHVFTLADVGGRPKPDPALFLHAAAALGSEPAACAVIEDAPYGVEAANRAGMTSVGLATTYRPDRLREAALVARSYAELPLEAVESAAERALASDP